MFSRIATRCLAGSTSMNCFVTGATGFIGANLVHELVTRGHRVKALLRPQSDLRGLTGTAFERVDGDLPAYLDTGLNWVHVRDVAIGHILATELGRVGERHILGHAEGNWSIRKTFSVQEEVSGGALRALEFPTGWP